ncbi:DNA mismatch repair protein MutS [bacterium]|nr:DNA mismatch repair protein MutS [bacterium]
MAETSELTPAMQQYMAMKKAHQDAILFFRMGDFYEMFFEDAVTASRVLELTLTARNKNQKDSIPLCGIPYHASQGYIQKLLANGFKVAVCEQMEDPKQAKGVVKREVVQVLTPGLVFDPLCLDEKSHNYLAAICGDGSNFSLAFVDVTTGVFKVTEVSGEEKLFDELLRLEPKEILVEKTEEPAAWQDKIKLYFSSVRLNRLSGFAFDADYASELVQSYYKVNPQVLGLEALRLKAVGAVLGYLKETKFLREGLIKEPDAYFFYGYMVLDQSTKKNLELTSSIVDGGKKGSLLWLLDEAQTPMGSRRIKDWLLYPLVDVEKINERLSSVEELTQYPDIVDETRSYLKAVSDMERILNRVLSGNANARDLKALADSLDKLPPVFSKLSGFGAFLLTTIQQNLDLLEDVKADIEAIIVDEPPLGLKEGGIIKNGISPDLDELRNIEHHGKSFISNLEAAERDKTGISSLKIRFNRVFGYYIEITNTHAGKTPPHYVRKQTLANAERYITDELKQYEDKVLGAGEKIKNIEYDLFSQLRERVATHSARIRKTASLVADLDALLSFATLAREGGYTKPQFVAENVLHITKGRHPVVEKLVREESFVPNDVFMNSDEGYLMMITGPNMAGKSTLMRQVAIITLLAHVGSFVPAEVVKLGVVDRIFTRIGASDFLSKGQSTFMVEMLETSQILKHATKKSLVILDEIGRGTSTFDGLSIAWAVSEDLCDRVKSRTLFATHYHELTDLAHEKPGIKNYHMAVKEAGGEIRFLRELRAGGTNRSYGVAVAQMAGLSPQVVARAKKILKLLEDKDLKFESRALHSVQPSLFDAQPHPVLEKLKEVDVNELTPLKALNLIAELIKDLQTDSK